MKKKNWSPKYFCVDSRAAKLVMRLPGEARLQFYDGLYKAFVSKVDGAEATEFTDDFVGDLLRQAVETLDDCFEVYRKRAFANLSGQTKSKDGPPGEQSRGEGNPMGMQCHGDGFESISSSEEEIHSKENLIRSRLRAEGYSDEEIQYALSRAKGRPDIRDLFSYSRATIETYRKHKPAGKTVSAQSYQQRDYSGEDAAAMQRMIDAARSEGLLA